MGTMDYKGYIGSAEVDLDSGALVGRLLYIRDSIAYSATTVEGLKAEFHAAVDEYLATCAELGDEPDQPCKGSFNVRVGPDRHRTAALEARKRGMSLNDFVCFALDTTCTVKREHHTHSHTHEVTVRLPQSLLTATATAVQPVRDIGTGYPASTQSSVNAYARH